MRNWILFCLIICGYLNLSSQVLMQLEIPHEINAIKFYEGSTIKFKSKQFPDDWQIKSIDRILFDEKILLFTDGMLEMTDITHIQMVNGTAKGIGKLFTGFGGGWLLFGGIAAITKKNKFDFQTAAIGVLSGGIGLLISNVFSKKTYTIGKNGNLRILDISFPEQQLEMKKTND